jgi:hypothetical protein
MLLAEGATVGDREQYATDRTTDMSHERPSASTLRRTVKSVAELHDQITVGELVAEVADRHGCREQMALAALDQMERHGMVYLVGDGATAEVRLP